MPLRKKISPAIHCRSVTYEYDDFQRLKKAAAGNFTREYSYDAWGNLTSLFNVTGPTETGNYTINYATNSSGAPANNRILNVNGGVTHSYDDAGNLAFDGWSYSHDAASRLKSVKGVVINGRLNVNSGCS